jgi:hypothetical protein
MVRLIAGTQEALSLAGGKGQEAPATPKWITPMLLFIDLYEKVSPVVLARFFLNLCWGRQICPVSFVYLSCLSDQEFLER